MKKRPTLRVSAILIAISFIVPNWASGNAAGWFYSALTDPDGDHQVMARNYGYHGTMVYVLPDPGIWLSAKKDEDIFIPNREGQPSFVALTCCSDNLLGDPSFEEAFAANETTDKRNPQILNYSHSEDGFAYDDTSPALLCSVTFNKTVVSDCFYDNNTSQSLAAVEIEVAWDETDVPGNPFNSGLSDPRMDSIRVTLGGQTLYVYLEAPANSPSETVTHYKQLNSPQVVTFFVPADGSTQAITAAFANAPACVAVPSQASLPSGCIQSPCAAGAGIVGGNVYEDFGGDGVKDPTDMIGLPNVEVRIYDCDGNGSNNLVATTQSDAYGDFQFAGLDDTKTYLVEFVPPASLSSFRPTKGSSSSYTTVQYSTTNNCDVNLGLFNPDNSCQPNPSAIVACYVKGAYDGQLADLATIVLAPYGVTDATASQNSYYATHGQTGAIWGGAYDASRNLLFTSAVLRRHVGLGPQGLGGLYVTDLNQPAATSPTSNFVDLDAGGFAFNFGTEPVRDFPAVLLPQAPSTDGAAFSEVGKVGIGDLDYDPGSDQLFLVNLEEKKLYTISLAGYAGPGTGTEPAIGAVQSFDIPDPGCGGGGFRPWALKIRDGVAYVGVTCDAAISQDPSDLRSKIYTFDIATSTFNPTPVLDFPLTYPKGFSNGDDLTGEWQPWEDDIQNFTYKEYFEAEVQPILSDIEFDVDGSMILALMDRSSSLQIGNGDNYPDGTNDATGSVLNGERGIAAGDILRAVKAGNTYLLENNAQAAGTVGYAANNFQGPGFGEFYNDNFYGSPTDLAHAEVGLGALSLAPGSGQVVATLADPVDGNIFSNGFRILDNTTGDVVNGYAIFAGTQGNQVNDFGKGGGLGDVELVCITPTELEVGNYFWSDVNGDGVQNPCEPLIGNVEITLFAADGVTALGMTITNAQGEYYFNNSNVNQNGATGLLPNTDYVIAVTSTIGMGPLEPYTSFTTTGGGAGSLDNNADATGRFSFSTTQVNDYSLDIGVRTIPPIKYDLALRKTISDQNTLTSFNPGDEVLFDIEIVNQSDTVVYDIVVGDSLPLGLSYVGVEATTLASEANGTEITLTDGNTASQTTPVSFGLDSLGHNDSVTFTVRLAIADPYTGTFPIYNVAEIQSFDNDQVPGNTPPTDEDSTPDTNFSNDAGGAPDSPADDVTTGNGTGTPGGVDPLTDEDDADGATLPYYDVALTKRLVLSSLGADMMPNPDEELSFEITVINQGNLPVRDVVVFDNVPCGFDFEGATQTEAWAGDNTGATITIASPIAPMATATVTIVLRVRGSAEIDGACLVNPERQVNRAEIASIDPDGPGGNPPLESDFDSVFDENDPNEDGGGVPNGNTDNVVTGDGSAVRGDDVPATDDDDEDPANTEVIDVALAKVIDAANSGSGTGGPYAIGDVIKFDVNVYNQGTQVLTNIDVVDLLPLGLEFVTTGSNSAWVYDTPSRIASTTISGPLMPSLTPQTVSIYATVVATTGDPMVDYLNQAEVEEIDAQITDPNTNMQIVVTRTQDADSPLDRDLGNNTGGMVNTPDDDNINGGGPARNEDQDNADPALVSVASLTLGSTVFLDNNNDGLQNGADTGIANVVVQLWNATTGMQVFTDANGAMVTDPAAVMVVTTNTDGNYLFSNLPPGDYYVVLPTVPASAPISSNNSGVAFMETDPDDNVDNDDEGLQAGGSGTSITSGTITLSSGMEPVDGTTPGTETAQGSDQDNAADANGNMTLDFGLFAPVTVGDTAFVDLDGNGLQSAGDQPLVNATVTIIDNATGQPVTLSAEGNPYAATQMTSVMGAYLFNNLPPGNYYVTFDISTADNAEFYDFTTPNSGNDAQDSDVVPATPTADVGNSSPTGPLTSGQSDLTLDAGVICAVQVTLADPFTICSTQKINLNEGASITPASLDGNWSTTDGTGMFDGGMLFSTATTYTPSPADALRGSVTLVLTTLDPDGPCEPVSSSITIQILKVDCGTFYWNGDD